MQLQILFAYITVVIPPPQLKAGEWIRQMDIIASSLGLHI